MDNNKLAKRPPIDIGTRGIEIRSFDELQRFAQAVFKSPFCPKDMNEAGVTVGMQFCMELGLNPVTGLQYIAIINGRPSLFGDAVLALCMNHPAFDHSAFKEEFEHSKEGVVLSASCTVRRLPDGNPVTRTWTLQDAKTAGLLGNPKKPIWKQYTGRMLQMRARSYALRDTFPDRLRGFSVIDEQTGEVIDGPDVVADVSPERPSAQEQVTSPMDELKARLTEKQHEPEDGEDECVEAS